MIELRLTDEEAIMLQDLLESLKPATPEILAVQNKLAAEVDDMIQARLQVAGWQTAIEQGGQS